MVVWWFVLLCSASVRDGFPETDGINVVFEGHKKHMDKVKICGKCIIFFHFDIRQCNAPVNTILTNLYHVNFRFPQLIH